MEKLAIFVSVVFIIAVASIATFIYVSPRYSTENIFMSAIEKSNSLDNYRIKYKVSMEFEGGSELFSLDRPEFKNIIFETFKKGNESRIDAYVANTSVRIYVLGEKTYTCGLSYLDKWVCQEGEVGASTSFLGGLSTVANTEKALSNFETMTSKGALIIDPTVEEKNIIGRVCDHIKTELDYSKLSKEDIEAMGGGFTGSTILTAMPSIGIEFCFDREKGVPLEFREEIDMSKMLGSNFPKMTIIMTAQEFETNLDFAPDFFELPATPNH